MNKLNTEEIEEVEQTHAETTENISIPPTPSLEDMLKAGVHFGHRTSKWHPRMGPYIYTSKNNVHVLNLELTQQKLEAAARFVKDLASKGKTILFVGTKKQVAPLIIKYATQCGMPYIATRWIGGLFTNFNVVAASARKLTKLKRQRDTGELTKYTKKERLDFDREITELTEMVGGIEKLMKLPDAVFVVDLKQEKTAVREAARIGLPLVAICDTNVDPQPVTHPIPANDDAIKAVDLIVSYISTSIIEGNNEHAAVGDSAPNDDNLVT